MRALLVGMLISAVATPTYAQDPNNDPDFARSNCKAQTTMSSGFSIAFGSVPPRDSPDPADRDFPLNKCLDEVRLAIMAHLTTPDGTLKTSDGGWVEFGEKGALTKCRYSAAEGAKAPEDLAKKILKYEGVLPHEPQEDHLNYSPELIHEWSKAIQDIIVIDCLVS